MSGAPDDAGQRRPFRAPDPGSSVHLALDHGHPSGIESRVEHRSEGRFPILHASHLLHDEGTGQCCEVPIDAYFTVIDEFKIWMVQFLGCHQIANTKQIE